MEVLVEFDYDAKEADELTIRKGDVISDVKEQDGGWWAGVLRGRRGMFPDNFVKVIQPGNAAPEKKVEPVTLRKGGGKRRCKVLYSYSPAHDDELELKVNDVIEFIEEIEEGWWRGRVNGKTGAFPSNFVEDAGNGVDDTKDVADGNVPTRNGRASDDDVFSTADTVPSTSGGRSTGSSLTSSSKKDKVGNDASDVPTEATQQTRRDDDNVPQLPPKPVKEQARVLFAYDAKNEDELTLKEGDIITVLSKVIEDRGWWKGELNGKIGVFPDNFVALIPVEEVRPKKPEKLVDKSPILQNKNNYSPSGSTSTSRQPSFTSARTSVLSDSTTSKKDEVAPQPLVNRKPVAPQPVRKAPRTPALVPTLLVAVKDGNNHDSNSDSGNGHNVEDLDFDSVGRNALLTQPARAKAPKRRPPSAILARDMEHGGIANGNHVDGAILHEDNIPEIAERHHHPTANNIPPAPWMEELKMNQAKRTSREYLPAKEDEISPFPKTHIVPDTMPDKKLPSLSGKSIGSRPEEAKPAKPARPGGVVSIPAPSASSGSYLLKNKVMNEPSGGSPQNAEQTSISTPSASEVERLRDQVKQLEEAYGRLIEQVEQLKEEQHEQHVLFTNKLESVLAQLKQEQQLRKKIEEKVQEMGFVV